MKIGFIGLGIMGSRMATNLLDADYELLVWNRTEEKAEPLVKAGATVASSPAEIGGRVEILITMLAHPDAVSETALGPNGFLHEMEKDTLWVDCSTVNPSFSRDMAGRAAAHEIRFLDAPVAGTKGPAAEGTLVFFVGGEEADVDACRPLFDVMGRQVVHVGGNGMGVSLKMVVNLMLAQSMLAFAEGMALGQALGLEQEMLLNTLIGGPVVAPFVQGKRPLIEADDYETAFPLKWLIKDIHLATLSAYEKGAALPLGAAAKETYTLAAREGLGDHDFSAIYRFLNETG